MKDQSKKITVNNFLLFFFVASLFLMGCQTLNKKIATINNGMTKKELNQHVKKIKVVGSKKIGQTNAEVYSVRGISSTSFLYYDFALLYFIDGKLVKYRTYDYYMFDKYKAAIENWEKKIDELYESNTPDSYY